MATVQLDECRMKYVSSSETVYWSIEKGNSYVMRLESCVEGTEKG